ncbi:MAG: SDR family oxidoreductase [Sphingomonadaceae bacterium]|nr:SDR family oxidoreductase [Sphingomonadaceae bacterium]
MGELDGKIAIVTGASQGIGMATAERMASEGATVIIGARTPGDEANPEPKTLAHTVSIIRSRGGNAHAIQIDMAKPESRAAFMDEALAKFGKIDIVINNAAYGAGMSGERLWEMDEHRFHKAFEVNVFGPRDLILRALPGMVEQNWGRIVNVSSTVADRAAPNVEGPPFLEFHRTNGVAAYASSKSALNLMTRSLAAELHGTGISANTVAPVNSVITENVQEMIDTGMISRDRFQAPEGPEVMAEAILALCLADPQVSTGLTTYSGQYLQQIARPVRGRDGGEYSGKITTESVKYDT